MFILTVNSIMCWYLLLKGKKKPKQNKTVSTLGAIAYRYIIINDNNRNISNICTLNLSGRLDMGTKASG